MAASKSDSFKHVNFQLPDVEKATLFNIIKDLVFSTNVNHRWIITISIFIQILLKRYLAYPLKIFGSLIEDLLNGNIFLSAYIFIYLYTPSVPYSLIVTLFQFFIIIVK